MTDDGGRRAVESWDSKTLYYVKARRGVQPLFARSVAGGPERQILDSITSRYFDVVQEGIYYIAVADEEGLYPLQFYDFTTGKSRVLTRIEGRALGVTVSPDRKTVLFFSRPPANSDLMLVENFR